MDELWTPWRLRYIASDKTTQGCIFCPGAAGEPRDRLLLARGKTTFTLLNLFPYTVGHLMVIPDRHLSRFSDLEPEERAEIARAVARAETILRRETGARFFHIGINLGREAGAGVEGHLHVHVVPRAHGPQWRGPEPAPGAEDEPIPVQEVHRRRAPAFAER